MILAENKLTMRLAVPVALVALPLLLASRASCDADPDLGGTANVLVRQKTDQRRAVG